MTDDMHEYKKQAALSNPTKQMTEQNNHTNIAEMFQ